VEGIKHVLSSLNIKYQYIENELRISKKYKPILTPIPLHDNYRDRGLGGQSS